MLFVSAIPTRSVRSQQPRLLLGSWCISRITRSTKSSRPSQRASPHASLFWSMTHRSDGASSARHSTRSFQEQTAVARFDHHRVPSCFPGMTRAASPTSCWRTITCAYDQSGHHARRQGPGPVAPQRRPSWPWTRPDYRSSPGGPDAASTSPWMTTPSTPSSTTRRRSTRNKLRRHHSPDRRHRARIASAHRSVRTRSTSGRSCPQSPRLRGQRLVVHLRGWTCRRGIRPEVRPQRCGSSASDGG